jgi:hypothetical protein
MSPMAAQPVRVDASTVSTKSRERREVVMVRCQKMKKISTSAREPVLDLAYCFGG